MRRSGRGRPSPTRRAIDQILRLAPSIRPPMLPVVSSTKATSTRGAATRTAGVTAVTRGGALARSAGTAGAAARSRTGIKACMVDLLGRVQEGLPDYSVVTSSVMAGRIDVNADLGESFGAWTMG